MKEKTISRRSFLKSAGFGAGALILSQWVAACQPAPEKPTPAANSEPTLMPAPTQAPDTSVPAAQSSPTGPAPINTPNPQQASSACDLAVARNGEPEAMVRATIKALGGMEKFVKPGAKVIVKPNICVAYHTYEYAATTNPWVVAALVKMSLEAGAKSVKVMDLPFGGTPEEAYKVSGIADLVTAAGGEMVVMPSMGYKEIEIQNAKALKKVSIFNDILTADTVIDVPIAKNHSLAILTLGMKNLMGVILSREMIHYKMGEKLTDLAAYIHPALTVVDAVRALMDNGPTGGNLDDVKQMNTVIASPDIVAADTYGASLFGYKPFDLGYIKAASEAGLGKTDLSNLKIQEINVGA
jgi:uncharacterized protein (DUF362 family)